MFYNKGIRASARRKPSTSSAVKESKRKQDIINGSDRKMRSLQSLQERFCFTLKRPRTSRARGGVPTNSQPKVSCGYGAHSQYYYHHNKLAAGKSTIMENGLIQIPNLHCDYSYESPSPLSISSSLTQESSVATTLTSTTTTSSACSSSIITHVSVLTHSPISSFDSSDDGFSCDEVMSLVSCPDHMVVQNVLDFMPSTLEDCCRPTVLLPADMCEAVEASRYPPPTSTAADMCETEAATLDQGKIECPSNVEDDGEPYRIDLCDFEPDVNALNSPPPQDGTNHQKSYGGGVLCLRLDYEEVLRAWKERGECLIAREPIYYPSPYLGNFGYNSFVPHPPFF